MSVSKLALITLAIAYVEARFGQEGLVQADIAALDAFGEPGAAATLAGQTPGVLLGGAGACDKLALADQIVSELGDDPEVISGAASLVAAEKNFNNFEADTGALCADPSLPATEALRGILPLFDPDVDGADVENANSATSLQTPFDATGLSEAEVALANGFDNFVAQDADGAEVDLAGLSAGGAASNDSAANQDQDGEGQAAESSVANAGQDDATATESTTASASATDDAAADQAQGNQDQGNQDQGNDQDQGGQQDDQNQDQEENDQAAGADGNAGASGAAAEDDAASASDNAGADGAAAEDDAAGAGDNAGAGGAADFGDCDPTIIFEGGLGGRPADEFTFQSADPTIAANQQEALNPDIIVNRICDELGNTCGANDAAIQACLDAQQDLKDQGLGVDAEGEDVLTAFNDAILAA